MKVHGSYVFKQKDKIILKGDNLITLLGESFFMNRAVNQHFEPIQYIVLGSSNSRPKKSDVGLGNLTVKKQVESSVDLTNKKIILKATFEAGEVLGTCEIGVANDDILISHDKKFDPDKLKDPAHQGLIGITNYIYEKNDKAIWSH